MSDTSTNKVKRVFIIDGYGQIYRSYFAFMSNPLKDKSGNNVSAVFGFFNTMMSLVRQYSPEYLVVAMDSRGKTFRHELYDQYKANREKAPEDLHAQVPVIDSFLDAMHIPHFERTGMEADDIIATISKKASAEGIQTVMVTGDKDLLQLVKADVLALRPPRKGEKEYQMCGSDEVRAIFGVGPEQIVDYLTILGDSSDNVPGISGIGEKGAVKLLSEYGTLDNAYSNISSLAKGTASKLEAAKDHIDLSRTLVTLKDDVFDDSEIDFSDFSTSQIDWNEGVRVFRDMGSETLAKAALRLVPADRFELS
ncbi:MAG: DNA polymerase I, partial [Spirochaetales bacterium]|nr:DNA polymerase I [Spirochaetales bacterium]